MFPLSICTTPDASVIDPPVDVAATFSEELPGKLAELVISIVAALLELFITIVPPVAPEALICPNVPFAGVGGVKL
jgi:hypothetical protein